MCPSCKTSKVRRHLNCRSCNQFYLKDLYTQMHTNCHWSLREGVLSVIPAHRSTAYSVSSSVDFSASWSKAKGPAAIESFTTRNVIQCVLPAERTEKLVRWMELSLSPKVLTLNHCCDFQIQLPSLHVLSVNTAQSICSHWHAATSAGSVTHSLCVHLCQVCLYKF